MLFCPERTALSVMSALLEKNAVEDIPDHVQLQQISSVVSQWHADETCCVCQASILFMISSAEVSFAAYKTYLVVLFVQNVTDRKTAEKLLAYVII